MSYQPGARTTTTAHGGPANMLAAYVPPLVVRRIASDGAPIASLYAEPFAGAILSTDITGFTTLTEAMDGRGPVGVEDLSRVLNSYFSELIGIIDTHGGAVMK